LQSMRLQAFFVSACGPPARQLALPAPGASLPPFFSQ
jgi:hypothetical protein